jgi:hypothetical protein
VDLPRLDLLHIFRMVISRRGSGSKNAVAVLPMSSKAHCGSTLFLTVLWLCASATQVESDEPGLVLEGVPQPEELLPPRRPNTR